MKFNKLLKSGIGAEETTASLYLRFGELKKQLKIMSQAMSQEPEGVTLMTDLSDHLLHVCCVWRKAFCFGLP
jgi:hypothetical protein